MWLGPSLRDIKALLTPNPCDFTVNMFHLHVQGKYTTDLQSLFVSIHIGYY